LHHAQRQKNSTAKKRCRGRRGPRTQRFATGKKKSAEESRRREQRRECNLQVGKKPKSRPHLRRLYNLEKKRKKSGMPIRANKRDNRGTRTDIFCKRKTKGKPPRVLLLPMVDLPSWLRKKTPTQDRRKGYITSDERDPIYYPKGECRHVQGPSNEGLPTGEKGKRKSTKLAAAGKPV